MAHTEWKTLPASQAGNDFHCGWSSPLKCVLFPCSIPENTAGDRDEAQTKRKILGVKNQCRVAEAIYNRAVGGWLFGSIDLIWRILRAAVQKKKSTFKLLGKLATEVFPSVWYRTLERWLLTHGIKARLVHLNQFRVIETTHSPLALYFFPTHSTILPCLFVLWWHTVTELWLLYVKVKVKVLLDIF